MEMNILPGMTAQNSEGLAFMLGVAGSDPQQETAMVQMLVEMLGVLVTDEARERGSDQAAGAAGNCRRSENAEQRAAGGGDR
jgi:hypothetical protein